ncbi:hypothetical protein [Blastochloris tepida]|uniref:Outer membrane protein beta-barrel domain-containing protein n=1 Tax=Blastochloris tepida TaxID=2233851 RepID=A0A348G018_9HYPH|nr:hypothetical protein [Blastochloris tepida]BBF92901.1 hypothetical protein BLTE_15860 [Blastochloris tepida]
MTFKRQSWKRQFSCGGLVAAILAGGSLTGGLLVGGLMSTAASAADLAPAPQATFAPAPSPWSVTVTPYLWAISLDGYSTVKGRKTEVNASFIDLVEHCEIPVGLLELSAFAEFRKDRFAVLADLVYTKVRVTPSLTRSANVNGVGGTLGISAGIDIEMTTLELAAAYELARFATPGIPGGTTAFDVYGGGRAWWQSADATFAANLTANNGDLRVNGDRTVTASGEVNWVDPLVGVRFRQQFSPTVNLAVSGDIGGFGAGSIFSWQALAALNWDFYATSSVTWSAMIGYKALYADYEKGSELTRYEYDMTMHGPVFGVSARF